MLQYRVDITNFDIFYRRKKMTRKIFTLLILTFLFITVLVSCSDEVEEIEITNINLDITETAIAPGESVTLVATVSPVGASGVSWHSSDNSVATVKGGVITAVGNGNAVIVCASDNGVFAMCRVTVDSGLCKHADIEWVIVSEPTCTATGLKYSYCKSEACGMRFSDEVIEMTPHTPAAAVKENEVLPTCTTEGSYDEVSYCIVCGNVASFESKTVAKAPHDFGDWTKTSESTCYVQGTRVQNCKNCPYQNEEKLPLRDHLISHKEGQAPTCTTPGFTAYDECLYSDCDYTTKQILTDGDHVYTMYFIFGNPTQSTSAKGMLTCSEDGCQYTASGFITCPALSSSEYTVVDLGNGKKQYTITVENDEGKLVSASFII